MIVQQLNNNLWEEKKLTEVKNTLDKETSIKQCDTMKEIKNQFAKNECNDTGEQKCGIVYKITNLINNKTYIGITTKSLNERKRGHIQACSSKNRKYLIHKAIYKYGVDNFIFEQLDTFHDTDNGRNKEIEYIKKYNSFYKNGNGYNMTIGGEGTQGFRHNHTEDTKQRISKKMIGKPKSEETKRKMKIAQMERKKWYVHILSQDAITKSANSRRGKKGIPHTEKSKQKLRLANLGHKHTAETLEKLKISSTGRLHTKETREKLRLINLGRKHSIETKHKLAVSHLKHIPDDIYIIIKECVAKNISPYKISGKLLVENNFKISRETIKKRFIDL